MIPNNKNPHSEHEIMNQIQLWCGTHNLLCFRANVGGVLTHDGRYFQTGLPKGFPDLFIIANKNHLYFVETKTLKGRQRTEQIAFERMCMQREIPYKICRSLSDFVEWITPHLK